MFFRLYPDIKCIVGNKKILCHSLMDGKVYYFEDEYKIILDLLLQNQNTTEIYKEHDEKICEELFEYVKNHKIGQFYDSDSIYSPNIKKFMDISSPSFSIEKFELESIKIRVTNKCNLNCIFCKQGDILNAPCLCGKSDLDNASIKKNITSIIEQAKDLGVRQLKLIGGEIYLERELVERIIEEASKNNIYTTVSTNGSLFVESDAVYLSKHNSHLVLNIFCINENDQYKLTGVLDYIEKVERTIYLLDKYKVKYCINYIRGTYNISDKVRGKFCTKTIYEKFILSPNPYAVLKNNLPIVKVANKTTTFNNYEINEKNNLCFRNEIFIESDGKIYPCSGLRTKACELGNISEKIYRVFQKSKYKEYWALSNFQDENVYANLI